MTETSDWQLDVLPSEEAYRGATPTADARMGPKEARSTVLTPEEEAVVVAFRRHTLLPLDDCLYERIIGDAGYQRAEDAGRRRPHRHVETPHRSPL